MRNLSKLLYCFRFRNHVKFVVLLLQILDALKCLQTTSCDNKFCNHEADCISTAGQPTCECIGSKYFTGTFCTDRIDNCQRNECRNGAQCTNALGQYMCGPCPRGFSGQRCHIATNNDDDNAFSGILVHHNRLAYLGDTTKFLLLLRTLGTRKFLLELHAKNYAIETFETDPKDTANIKTRWLYSHDFVSLAHSIGLRHAEMLPINKGYYHITNAQFWNLGLHSIELTMLDSDNMDVYAGETYTMMILPHLGLDCLPEIQLEHCSNQFEPLRLDIARYNSFEPIVARRCYNDSALTFQWTLYNAIQTVVLRQFPQTNKPLLKIPPYTFGFNYHGEVMQSYMLKILLREHRSGRRTIDMVARCYVFVLSKPVSVHIKGGVKRKVNILQDFEIDGSNSRDFALAPHKPQHFKFSWSCKSSDDPTNAFCRPKMGQEGKLVVPVGTLKVDCSYSFTLHIVSLINIFSSDTQTQIIETIAHGKEPLQLDILCVRNCQQYSFVANELVHLTVKCYNCPTTGIRYAWQINNEPAAKTKRLLYRVPQTIKILDIKANVQSGQQHGKAITKLKQNVLLDDGTCSIEPSTGIEFQTLFKIECKGFEKTNKLLVYQYYAADVILDRTNDPSTSVHLPRIDQLKVKVCDSLGACCERQLPVSITALEESDDKETLQQLLQTKDYNIEKMLENGDTQAAMALGLSLIRSAKTIEMSEIIFKHFANFRLTTLMHTEQLLKITRDMAMMKHPIMDYQKADLLSRSLFEIAAGLEYVLNDSEVRDIYEESYKSITQDLTNIMSVLSVKWENFPECQKIAALESVNSMDRLAEVYNNFTEFDPHVLIRIESWLQASLALHRCVHLLGRVAVHVYEPSEEGLLIKPDASTGSDLQIQVLSIEQEDQFKIASQPSLLTVHMTHDLISQLRQQLHSEDVVLQIITAGKDPFWWYPCEYQLNTAVHYISANSRHSTATWHSSKSRYELSFMSKDYRAAENVTAQPTDGQLESENDMAVFRFILNKNALLSVRFTKTSVRMRLLFSLNKKPRGHMVRHSNKILAVTSSNPGQLSRTYTILNDVESSDSPANVYLALMPANGEVSDDITWPARFAFTAEVHECLSWRFDLPNPAWTTAACRPRLKSSPNASGLFWCNCRHMSAYAGRISPIASFSLFNVGHLVDRLPLNWLQIVMYVMFAIILLCIILLSNRNQLPKRLGETKNNDLLIIANYDEFPRVKRDKQDMIIRINTGSIVNAETTADIVITIYTTNGQQNLKLYQNPQRPQLKRNSSCAIRLRTPIDEQTNRPIEIIISHNNAGRFPSWYCRSIDFVYFSEDNRKLHHFPVDRWLTKNSIIYFTESSISSAALETYAASKRKNFRNKIEELFINWFHMQPICGPNRHGGALTCFNRFQRTCICCMRCALSVFIVTCFFGWTTLSNYEDEREFYAKPILDFHVLRLLIICIVSYLASFVVQVVIVFSIAYLKR